MIDRSSPPKALQTSRDLNQLSSGLSGYHRNIFSLDQKLAVSSGRFDPSLVAWVTHRSELPGSGIPDSRNEDGVSFLWKYYIHRIIPTIRIIHVKTGMEIDRITIFWIFSIFYPFY